MINNELMTKGKYEPINEVFLTESLDAFQKISEIQRKYDKGDTDTFMNEVRDSIVAKILNFTHINVEKHGFDARRVNAIDNSESKYEFLEVKASSFTTKSWGATFNDTTIEKAEMFQKPYTKLALSVWREAADLSFIVYGSSKKLGIDLEKKVKSFLSNDGTVRSTQTISIGQLVNTYGFNVYSVHKTPGELYNLFQVRTGTKKIPKNKIFEVSDLVLK